MSLRTLFITCMAVVQLLAGFSPFAAAAASAADAEHCAPETGAHAGMHHDEGSAPMAAEPDEAAQENCGHECRQCAACAMMPPAVAIAVSPHALPAYAVLASDFRLTLRADELLRPPI